MRTKAGNAGLNGAVDESSGGRRILLVEDDPTIRMILDSYLLSSGFSVDIAADGPTAVRLVEERHPDLVILDRMLPGLDGAEVCRRIRGRSMVPIIMLTALGTESDRVHGFELGADDYVTKPFSPRELILRVRSVLRRTVPDHQPEPPVNCGEFRLDPATRTIRSDAGSLTLTMREYELLAFFLRHPNQVFTREELIRAVWGWNFGDLSTVTVHVRRIREKIEKDAAKPTFLTTVWGVGYQLTIPNLPDAD